MIGEWLQVQTRERTTADNPQHQAYGEVVNTNIFFSVNEALATNSGTWNLHENTWPYIAGIGIQG